MSKWKSSEGGEMPWYIENGQVTIEPGTGDIETRDVFGSFQLYIEWKTPVNKEHEGQGGGNACWTIAVEELDITTK